jgi:hypothetical protein
MHALHSIREQCTHGLQRASVSTTSTLKLVPMDARKAASSNTVISALALMLDPIVWDAMFLANPLIHGTCSEELNSSMKEARPRMQKMK